MPHFRQRIPDFVSDVESEEFDFDTVDELLAHEIPQRWSKMPGFQKFSQSEGYLMAEYIEDDGPHSWVVGYLTQGTVDLALWVK